jgi:hypothetical protein
MSRDRSLVGTTDIGLGECALPGDPVDAGSVHAVSGISAVERVADRLFEGEEAVLHVMG